MGKREKEEKAKGSEQVKERRERREKRKKEKGSEQVKERGGKERERKRRGKEIEGLKKEKGSKK